MTTRREFIQGILTGMVALVLPKTAKAMPVDEPEETFLTLVGKQGYFPDGPYKPLYAYCTSKERAQIARLNELCNQER